MCFQVSMMHNGKYLFAGGVGGGLREYKTPLEGDCAVIGL
jgi:hypothetical protein